MTFLGIQELNIWIFKQKIKYFKILNKKLKKIKNSIDKNNKRGYISIPIDMVIYEII